MRIARQAKANVPRKKAIEYQVEPKKRKNPGGRPTKYTKETIEKVCQGLRQGLTYKYAAEIAGISEARFYEYKNKYQEFREAVEAAKAENAAFCMRRIVELAEKREDPKAYQWILANGHRNQYHTKQETQIEGGKEPVKVEIKIDLE